MSHDSYFHVGIIVPDLDVARDEFSRLLGTEWGPIAGYEEMQLRHGSGADLTVPSRLCYSTEPPYLELIEEVPGTTWVCNPFSNLHHIGFFTDALVERSEALIGAGCPLALAGRVDDTAPVTFTVHAALGIHVEHLDVAMRATVEGYLCKAPRS